MSIEAIGAAGAWKIEQIAAAGTPQTRSAAEVAPGFGAMLEQGLVSANTEGLRADAAMEQLVQSQGANLHEAMIAMSRAELATKLAVKVGQKLVQAYQEVSRMQL